jgi:hypothetical protein
MSGRSAGLIAWAAVAAAIGCAPDAPDPAPGTGGGSSSQAANAVAASSSGAAGGALPETFTVTGVVTDGAAPVAGAIVMQGGGAPLSTTGPDGAFSITLTTSIAGTPTVVAAKEGYRSAGLEFVELPSGPVELVLREAAPPDNALGYTFGAPGVGDPVWDNSTAFCGHCHTTFVAEFQQSAHARATKDPLVQDLYAGVSRAHADAAGCAASGGAWRAGRVPGTAGGVAAKCYLGGGVLPDLNACGKAGALSCDDPALPVGERPKAFGHCADCHAAGLDGPGGGRDLLEATGIAFENGNHCDTCHKVADIDLDAPPGRGGRLVVQRPRETISDEPGAKLLQVMFGPLPDVPNAFMGGSYQPKFSKAVFCAGCHEQKQEALVPGTSLDPSRWPDGLPVHSTYTEWKASPWGTDATACQHCHMPPLSGLFNTLDVTEPDEAGITFGFVRPPEQIRSHGFRGPLDGSPRLLDLSLGLWMSASVDNGALAVSVTLKNQGAGHALPTGEPMRALLLLVRADACGVPLVQSGGMTVPDTGGALALGVVGQDVAISGAALAWPAGALQAKPGHVVRVVRWTGAWDDYPGIGFFAEAALGPADKGIPVRAPVGEARVSAVSGGGIDLDGPIAAAAPGDIVLLGDAIEAPPLDGGVSIAVAGSAGHAFSRVLVDPAGTRGAPHHRAIDVVSDNRLPPLEPVKTWHAFSLPQGCASATVTATAVYRPVPLLLARERGWEARDWVAATTKEIVAIR